MTTYNSMKIPEIAVAKWRRIADFLAEFADVPFASVNILEEEGQLHVIGGKHLPSLPSAEGDVIHLDTAGRIYCAAVISARDLLVVEDAAKSDFWKDSPGAKAGLTAYAGVPIFTPDNDIFGAICLFDRKPCKFEGPVVPLMKEFSDLITGHLELIKKNNDLEQALKEVRTLQGLVPICAQCKKIRDDKGYWEKVEVYLEKHSQARFTHGLCEECMHKLYGNEKWFKEKHPGK